MPEKKHKKQYINKYITLLVVLILSVFLTACTLADLPYVGKYFGGGEGDNGSGTPVSKDSGSITVWGLWDNTDVVDALILKYNEKYPNVSVTHEDRSVFKPLVDYKETAFRRAADETGPDVMRVHVSWVPRLMNSLVPLPESAMSTAEFREKFYPSAAENLIIDDKIYGIPSYYDGLVLVYNKAHFAEVGQVEPPTAWEEFRKLALSLTVRGDDNKISRAGAAIGTADNIDFFSDIIGLLFAQANVSIPTDVDGKAAQDALAFYTNFYNEDKVWSKDLPEASVAFSQERVSMIFVPVWNLADILAARPDLDIGVAPVPQVLPDQPKAWANYWVDVVPVASDNPEVAWNYILFMASPEQQLFNFSESSKYRVYGAPYSLVSLASELDANPYLSPVLKTATYAKTSEMAARVGNRRQVDALKEAVNSVTQAYGFGRDYGKVLSEVKAELSR